MRRAKMSLKDLTVETVSDMILEQYEKKHVKPHINEIGALALLIADGRRIKPELKLAKAYAAKHIFDTKPQGWKAVRHSLRYKRILTLPKTVKVLMIPPYERFELLRTHPKFKQLVKKSERKGRRK